MAAYEGRVDVVRLLTEAKADVNIQTEVRTYTMSRPVYWSRLHFRRGKGVYVKCCMHVSFAHVASAVVQYQAVV